MNYLLKGLLGCSVQLRIGRYQFYTYFEDRTMAVRQDKTGLMSPSEKISKAGLMRLLAWIDKEEAANPHTLLP